MAAFKLPVALPQLGFNTLPLDLRRRCGYCALHGCRERFKDVNLSREQKQERDHPINFFAIKRLHIKGVLVKVY